MTTLPTPPDHAGRARRVLVTSLAITAVLFVIPGGGVIGYPLLLISTYVHELGHGLAAILVGGDFVRLEIFTDGSGVATTRSGGGGLSRAVIAGGGLVGPAVGALVALVVGRREPWAQIGVVVGGLLGLVAAVVWVRSLIGFAVALGVAAVSLVLGLVVRRPAWSQLWVVFLGVQLGLSVFSRREYLFARSATTGAGVGRSDSAALADALVGPYWLWGAVCGLLSLTVLAAGGWFYIRGDSRGRQG